MTWVSFGTAALGLLVGSDPARAVSGRIVQAGFRAGVAATESFDDISGKARYREGTWLPILVELSSEGNAPAFEGTLRIVQRDRDGDLAITEQPVAVQGQRRYWLYPVAAPLRDEYPFSIQLLDADGNVTKLRDLQTGEAVDRLVSQDPLVALATEEYLILDISDRLVPQLLALRSPRNAGDEDAANPFTRPPLFGRLSPKNLPPHACGLDPVNAIVWDNADPSTLADAHQLQAIIEWVYRGGILVLGVGATWEPMQKSPLEPLLPGPLSAAAEVRTLTMDDKEKTSARELRKPIVTCPLARSTLRQGSRVLESDRNLAAERNVMICRRAVGRGQVVYVGARLRDLSEAGVGHGGLMAQLLGLRRQTQGEAQRNRRAEVELFPQVVRMVGFETESGLYLLFALVFVAAYILLGTLGTWHWLRSRDKVRHSWLAFAAVTVVASLLSLGAVRVIRGIGHTVEELSVVDLRAVECEGQPTAPAVATSFFGLRTGSHERLDVIQPGDWAKIDEAAAMPCSLRVLPAGPGQRTESFVAPETYRTLPTRARVEDVPFRATLKQFEGTWHGELHGRVVASLTCREINRQYELDDDAWIRNELGTDLQDCLLILAESDPDPKGATRRWAGQLRVVPIQGPSGGRRIRQGETVDRLRTLAYDPNPGTNVRRRNPAELAVFQAEWASRLGAEVEQVQTDPSTRVRGAGPAQNALLLLTTFAELRPVTDSILGSRDLARTNLAGLDLSDLITKDTALLVGFSNAPGPARLCCRTAGQNRRFRPLTARSAMTLYRILIPMKVRGAQPAAPSS